MTTNRTTRIGHTQADVQAHLVRLLLAGEQMTAMQAAKRLGCGDAHARRALVALHDAALVYVVKWERMGLVGSPWCAVYAWCGDEVEDDAPHPRRDVRATNEPEANHAP